MPGFLVLFHCESNPGFAASSHEHTFMKVAKHFAADMSNVHYAYRTIKRGMTSSLPNDLTNVIELDTAWKRKEQNEFIINYIKKHKIKYLLGFDQPLKRPMYKHLRKAGIKHFVSYWGAPMSSINAGLKLLFKKVETTFPWQGPDHYVFQSTGMQEMAVLGRGIPAKKTSVIHTGIDTDRYTPDLAMRNYPYEAFNIPSNRKIVFFSGHMEPRKGVHIILKSANILVNELNYDDVHFLILGNKPGQEKDFDELLQDPNVRNHVTFGGYRTDVPKLLKGVSLGMIASTGWDSFPMSSLEIAATEIPLIVSDLPGLNEAITPETGRSFPVGDFVKAAYLLHDLLNDDELRTQMGKAGRKRVVAQHPQATQANQLIQIFQHLQNPTDRETL
ncbi:MAG: glycosyltransferase family 4 protein [Reinekea sp.]